MRLLAALGLFIAIQDLVFAARGAGYLARGLPLLLFLLAQVGFGVGGLSTLGLGLRPAQGWWHWARLSVRLGGCVLLAGGLVWVVARLFGHELGLQPVARDRAATLHYLEHAVLYAPLLEEGVWRLVLCAALLPLVGARATVLVAGVGFAALHWLYGNPAPDNLVAGFVLAWAYLASGSIWVPIALHAAGNLCVLVLHALWMALG